MTDIKLIRSYDEVDNIRTFAFETADLDWTPGYYGIFILNSIEGDDKAKRHFFTVASAPSEGEIHITTRVSDSVYKQTLNALAPGDTIEVSKIEGDFTWDDDNSVVYVAGGIGITPFRSMIVERANTGRSIPAHLLYFGRDENFAFKSEFDKIAQDHPELKIDYIAGERITVDTIVDKAPEAVDVVTYLSGPEPMVDAVGSELSNKGVNLKQDWFPGYDDTSY